MIGMSYMKFVKESMAKEDRQEDISHRLSHNTLAQVPRNVCKFQGGVKHFQIEGYIEPGQSLKI